MTTKELYAAMIAARLDLPEPSPWLGAGERAIHRIAVFRDLAFDAWNWLRSASPQLGHWPVLVGGPDDEATHAAAHESHEPPEAILRQAAEINPGRWLSDRGQTADFSVVPRGGWPSDQPAATGFQSGEMWGLEGIDEVTIALVPTTKSWRVPAWLSFGDWNDCPPPSVHVALLRDWHARYGAELGVLRRDVLECAVARPPIRREDAVELAREQFVYCPDIVEQGTETLENLAAMLKNGRAWYFWWD